MTYTDANPLGPLGPHSTGVGAAVEFCGNVLLSCGLTTLSGNFGVLINDDTIDFDSVTIVFDLEGGFAELPAPNDSYVDLNLDPTARFSITGMTFDVANAYLADVSVQLTDAIGVAVGREVTFTSNSINFLVGTLGVSKQQGRGQIAMTLDIQQRTTPPPPPLPEPSSLMLLGAGLVATAGAMRRRMSR